jgi:hypothetical protein
MNIAGKTEIIDGAGRGMGQALSEFDTHNLLVPVPNISLSSDSGTFRKCDSTELIQRVNSLETERLSLQILVCDLLHENEQLRNRNLNWNPHIAGTVHFHSGL